MGDREGRPYAGLIAELFGAVRWATFLNGSRSETR